MRKCSLVFLFDSGQVFEETWNLSDNHAISVPMRLRQIAQARCALLAANVNIVRLKASGHPTERVAMVGTAGNFAWPRDGLRVLGDMWTSSAMTLRGVPRDLIKGSELTSAGTLALAAFSKTLRDCECFIVRSGKSRPIAELPMRRKVLYSWRKDKKATLRKLKSILGEEKAIQFWKDLKERERARKVHV